MPQDRVQGMELPRPAGHEAIVRPRGWSGRIEPARASWKSARASWKYATDSDAQSSHEPTASMLIWDQKADHKSNFRRPSKTPYCRSM